MTLPRVTRIHVACSDPYLTRGDEHSRWERRPEERAERCVLRTRNRSSVASICFTLSHSFQHPCLLTASRGLGALRVNPHAVPAALNTRPSARSAEP